MLALFLVLGAIVNVAVAWGLAAIPSKAPLTEIASAKPDGSPMLGEWIILAQRRTPGRAQNWLQGRLLKDVRLTHEGQVLTLTGRPSCGLDQSGPWEIEYPIRTASWSRLGFVHVGRKSLYIEAETASGWPTLSLWGCMSGYDRDSGERTHTGCVGLGEMQRTDDTDSHETCLPYWPIWPGFAINTVFYAFIVWLLSAAPFALRKRRRIKRGLCPKCAYPVGTSDKCTECGAALPFSRPLTGT
jgi:hypothetical protein